MQKILKIENSVYDLSLLGDLKTYTKEQEPVIISSLKSFNFEFYKIKYRNSYIFDYDFIRNRDLLEEIFEKVKNHKFLYLTNEQETKTELVLLSDLNWDYFENKMFFPKISLKFTSLNLTEEISYD